MVEIYRKITAIQAERFVSDMDIVNKYQIKIVPDHEMSGVIDELVPKGKYYLKTLEGELEVHLGDWIATGVNGEHWAIRNDVFKKTYKEV